MVTTMVTVRGTYRNPRDRSCFVGCASCFRCEKRASSACPIPNGCSGRPDEEGVRVPHPDDLCRCKEGNMQWVTRDGKVLRRRFTSSPFASKVITDSHTQDDRDWNAFVTEKREALNDENWDPLQFHDGTSVTNWTRKHYGTA